MTKIVGDTDIIGCLKCCHKKESKSIICFCNCHKTMTLRATNQLDINEFHKVGINNRSKKSATEHYSSSKQELKNRLFQEICEY